MLYLPKVYANPLGLSMEDALSELTSTRYPESPFLETVRADFAGGAFQHVPYADADNTFYDKVFAFFLFGKANTYIYIYIYTYINRLSRGSSPRSRPATTPATTTTRRRCYYFCYYHCYYYYYYCYYYYCYCYYYCY